MDNNPKNEANIAEREADRLAEIVEDAKKIKKPEDLKKATEVLSQIKTLLKTIDNKKKSIIQPLKLSIKEITDLFTPSETRLKGAESELKMSVLDYQAKVEEKNRKKAEKIEQQNAEGKIDLNQSINKMAKLENVEGTIKSDGGGELQFRTLRKVRIVDELKIPREYLVPDTTKINKVALAGVEIPGVEVYEEKTVASKAF